MGTGGWEQVSLRVCPPPCHSVTPCPHVTPRPLVSPQGRSPLPRAKKPPGEGDFETIKLISNGAYG